MSLQGWRSLAGWSRSAPSVGPLAGTGRWSRGQGCLPLSTEPPAAGSWRLLPSAAEVRRSLPPELQVRLADYPSVLTIPLQWGEMDVGGLVCGARWRGSVLLVSRCPHPSTTTCVTVGTHQAFGHLNNVVMGRYFESGRRAYFDQVLGPHLSPEQHGQFVNAQGVGPIIKSVSITYRSPAEYPDLIAIGVRVDPARVGRDRFTQEFLALSHTSGRVVAEGEAVVVCFDYAHQRKADIPEYVLAAFRRAVASLESA